MARSPAASCRALARPAGAGERAIADWSKMKYKRFVDAIGGWDVLQTILLALDAIAPKHGVSIANVATRWVLDQPAVAAVIVGARLGEREHATTICRLLVRARRRRSRADRRGAGPTTPLPGDCGDEYRRPPYLTASGDLSHHLERCRRSTWRCRSRRPGRPRVSSGSVWEPVCGYSRAVRVGDRILVSGTTATHGAGEWSAPAIPLARRVHSRQDRGQPRRARRHARGRRPHPRLSRDAGQWEPVSRVHGRRFGSVRPANTLVEVSGLIGEYEVEIEAEAVVG